MAFFRKPEEAIAAILGRLGIDQEKILAFCEADMDTACHFAGRWLILTAERLILASLPEEAGVKTYSGYANTSERPALTPDQITLKEYDLSLLTGCGMLELVSGGMFYISTESADESVCGYGGHMVEGIRRFCEVLNKKIKNEDFSELLEKKDDGKQFCPKCGSPYPERERKVCPRCLDKRSIFIRMLSYFRPHRRRIIIMMACSVIGAVVYAVLPYISGKVYFDDILMKNPAFAARFGTFGNNWFLLLGLVMLTVLVMKIIMSLTTSVQQTMVAGTVPDVVRRIKDSVFSSLKNLSLKFFLSKQTGGLMTRVLGDAAEVTGFFIDGMPYILSNLLTVIIVVTVMFIFNWQLTVMTLFLIPLLIYFSIRLQPRLWHLHGRRHRASRGLNSVLNDSLTGARVIKAFGKEDVAGQGFSKENRKVGGAEVDLVKYETRYVILFQGVRNLMVLLVWAAGAYLIVRSGGAGISYGMLAAFISYVAMLSGPMDYMVNLFRWWASSLNAAQRIFEIIDAVPDVTEKPGAEVMQAIKGDVEIKNVTFSYESGHPVLKNISAKIEAGKMLGVVGRSGVGKTTLISLISRLYDPEEGEILADGKSIRDYTLSSLRSNVAVVSQESYVFMGTAAENIAYADPEAEKEEIIKAAVAASAHDFICKMPDGYDTLIGSGSRQLSGGERQRVSVARAVLANPRILILDEATASVDTETERSIQRALDRLIKGRTTISIAHRLSTLNNADTLIVLDEGAVAETGTHRELMAKKGIYFKLVELQQQALLKKTEESGGKQAAQSADSKEADSGIAADEANQKEGTFMEEPKEGIQPAAESDIEKEADEQLEIRYINKDNAEFAPTPGGFVSLKFMGGHYPRIGVYRAFPFTDPESYISIRKPDEKAAEIGIIKNLSDLTDAQAALIRSQVNLRYFTPRIRKILEIKEEYGYSYWNTVTDRGACRFTVGQGGVSRIGADRLIISDIDGNRFEIPSIAGLTAKELRMVDLYI